MTTKKYISSFAINKKDILTALNADIPKHYYTLSFSYTFEYDFDTVSMAFAEPYTYSNLQNDLESIEHFPKKKRFLTRELLCKSIAGNRCELLTITAPIVGKNNPNKKGVIFTGRVHPGETVGSWMMKGVIDFLLSDERDAEILRQNYIFKIVPMLNPDGVIQGNYRTSLAGCDLNRRYVGPSKILHPCIFYLKKMARKFFKDCPLVYYCDFHGHSKRFDI